MINSFNNINLRFNISIIGQNKKNEPYERSEDC